MNQKLVYVIILGRFEKKTNKLSPKIKKKQLLPRRRYRLIQIKLLILLLYYMFLRILILYVSQNT